MTLDEPVAIDGRCETAARRCEKLPRLAAARAEKITLDASGRPAPRRSAWAEAAALIRRRHVFYVEGYDPQGAAGYHKLFRRESKRFLTVWPLRSDVSDLAIDSDDLAHWDVATSGPNWRVGTRYEFLRLEAYLSANLAQPMARQLPRTLWWMLGDVFSGTLLRILRASWRFGLHLIVIEVLLLAWIATAVGAGVVAGEVAARVMALPVPVGVAIGIAAGVGSFAALRPLADRWHLMQVINGWPYLREFSRGQPTGYDRPVNLFAERIVAAARAGEADEILIVSHSAGGVISPAIVARALELDPDLGRHGPRVILMTLGSLMPGLALHPAADRLRAAVSRLAVEPSVLWVDCQARKDVMNFHQFDPVAGVGIRVGAERCNPVVWSVRIRDMLSDDAYRRFRSNYFRIHFQFIMSNSRRAPYDYFMLVCGPLSVAEWIEPTASGLAAFSADAALAEASAALQSSPDVARSEPF